MRAGSSRARCRGACSGGGESGLGRGSEVRKLIGAMALGLMMALGLVVSGSALAQTCDDDTIDFIAGDGSVIRMQSGAAFRVSALDQSAAAGWLTMDDVLICKDATEIVNKDRDGERVAVKRLRH